jgi:hypothetical protein
MQAYMIANMHDPDARPTIRELVQMARSVPNRERVAVMRRSRQLIEQAQTRNLRMFHGPQI